MTRTPKSRASQIDESGPHRTASGTASKITTSKPDSAHSASSHTSLYIVSEMRAKPGNGDAVRALLADHAAKSREDDGNIRFEALSETRAVDCFLTVEIWASRDALERHQKTDHYKRFKSDVEPHLRHAPTDRFAHTVDG